VAFKLYLSILTALLFFSTYMMLATAGIVKPYPMEVLRFENVIPYDKLSRQELASRYAMILGDEVKLKTNEIKLPGCIIDYYTTTARNRVQVGFCRGEFRFISYINEQDIRLRGFTTDLGTSLDQLLRELSGDPYFMTDFTREYTVRENGDRVIRGYQTLGGYRILGSGYYIEENALEGIIKTVMLYDVYRKPLLQPIIPEPKLSELMSTIKEKGFSGFTYKQPIIQGIKVCGDRITYSLRVISEQSTLHGYEALIDAYTGEVVLLIGLSALGVFRVWQKAC